MVVKPKVNVMSQLENMASAFLMLISVVCFMQHHFVEPDSKLLPESAV